jgi:hypothetical protein
MVQIISASLAAAMVFIAVAVLVGRATERGRRPWLPLASVWGVVVLGLFLVLDRSSLSVASALLLLAPLGVTALAVNMEVQRGCSLRWAVGVGVVLGVAVAAAIPFAAPYLMLLPLWTARVVSG